MKHRAAGYAIDEAGSVKNQEWVAPSLNRCADGALYFSANDLASWFRALDARTFLRPASFDAWWTPVRLANGFRYPYGFGWRMAEQRGERLIEQLARLHRNELFAIQGRLQFPNPRLLEG